MEQCHGLQRTFTVLCPTYTKHVPASRSTSPRQKNNLWISHDGIWAFLHGDLHTKRSPTQSDIYQMLYWYNWFSWWWARGCSKHAENWNKHIEKNCALSWSFTKNHNKMHGQQNIKFRGTTVAVPSCSLSDDRVGLSITGQSLSTVHTLLQTVCTMARSLFFTTILNTRMDSSSIDLVLLSVPEVA